MSNIRLQEVVGRLMKRRQPAILVLILVLSFLTRVPFMHEPLDGDQAVFACMGAAWNQGWLLYRDLTEYKPPLIFFAHGLINRVCQASVPGIHLAFIFLALLSIVLFFFMANYLFSKNFALLSTFLYGIFSSGALISGTFANADNLMVFFNMAALYIFWMAYRKESSILFLLSGIFLGSAVMTKQSGACEGLGISVFLYLMRRPQGKIRQAIRSIVFIWTGALLVSLLCWFIFFIKGAGGDFIDSVVVYNFFYGRIVGVRQGFLNFLRALSWTPRENFPLWFLSAVGVYLAIRRRSEVPLFLCVWFCAALMGVAMSLRFYPHYFIQVTAPLALLSTFTLEQLFWQKNFSLKKKSLGALALAVILIVFMRVQWKYYFQYSPEESLVKRRAGYVREPLAKAIPEIAAFLKKNTVPKDLIYVWGYWPEVYFYAQRFPSSRLFFITSRGVMIGSFADFMNQRVLADTAKRQPKYFIIDYYFADLMAAPLRSYLQEHYGLETKIAGCEVLKRL